MRDGSRRGAGVHTPQHHRGREGLRVHHQLDPAGPQGELALHFLPSTSAGRQLLRRSKEAKAVGNNIGYKTYEVLVYQIWLLSDLCKCDTASSKKFLASSLPQLPG